MPSVLNRPVCIAVVLFFACLVYYTSAALNFPGLFNLDNHANYQATRYIATHHRVPVVEADDPEIYFNEIGTTRSLRPPFTFIVSAMVGNLAAAVVEDPVTRLRLGSPLIAALTVVVMFTGFWLAFNHLGLALLGATAIGLLPKFVFLASCNNDDIGAIFSISLLFTSILALLRHGPRNWLIIGLVFALGLVLQSKFTAWLTLPWLGLYSLWVLKPAWKKVIKRLPLLLLVIFVAGGWWPVFNMVNYGISDPTAMRHAVELQASLSDIEPNRRGYLSEGIDLADLLGNHDQFLSRSYKSLVGYLEWLNLEMGTGVYLFYGSVFLIGILGIPFSARRAGPETKYLAPLILVLIISQCWFYLHHNLVRDVQPQARYLLPVVMPMMYLFLSVLAALPGRAVKLSLGRQAFGSQVVAVSLLLATCIALHLNTMNNYIRPSYTPQPYHVSISKPQEYRLQDTLKVVSASALVYEFSDQKLKLRRTGEALPTLVLDADFCRQLPLNALITMEVSAPLKGGIYLRLDHDKRGTFDDLYWRSFPAGQSTALFAVNSRNCSGAKITLAKRTHQLTLNSLLISDLRMHRHGKPI